MWRRLFMAGMTSALFFPVCAQVTKQFSVENKSEIKKVNFSFKVNGGYCILQAGNDQPDLISIYTNENLNNYSHQYTKDLKGSTCNVSLALVESSGESLSQKMSYSMFGSNKNEPEKIWKTFLEPSKPYRLNLNYGMGVANIDLSGLAVENLKVYSGKADVKIDYNPTACNLTQMDTFFVKVDLGSVVVKRTNLYKSNLVLAEVGFGDMYLDFSDRPSKPTMVKGSVGAGNLLITLPQKEIPVLIKINQSWLCKVKLSDNFRQIDSKTYINESYIEGAPNLLTFDLDVSMGSIIFKSIQESTTK